MNTCPRIAAVLLVALACAVPGLAGPKLLLSAQEWSFGEVWQGTPLSFELTIKNVGDAPLEIPEVKSSCGCTVASKPKSPLAPGESDTVKVTFDSVKRRDHQAQTITFITNDPEAPEAAFRVVGTVKPVYDIKSGVGGRLVNSMSFGRLFPGTHEARTVEIFNRYKEALELKLIKGQDFGDYEIVLETLKPGQHYKLTVTPKNPLPIGEARGRAQFETGLDVLPNFEILVFGSVQPPVSITPAELRLPRKLVMPLKQTLAVWCAPDKPVKIVAVKANAEAIKVQVRDAKPDPSQPEKALQEIVVELPPPSQLPADLEPAIEIETDADDPAYRKLTIPIKLIGPA